MTYPVVKQRTNYDCGIACIATILEYLQIPYEYNSLLIMENINEQSGCSMEQLQRILKNCGINSWGYFADPKKDWDLQGKIPFIARLKIIYESYHYVTVYEWKKDFRVYADPYKGKICKMDVEIFTAEFTGHILAISNLS